MPEPGEKCRKGPAKEPLPDPEAREQGQIISQPQVSPAQAEGALQPGRCQTHAQKKLRQPGQAPVEGPDQVRRRTQQRSPEKASQEPGQEDRRRHDRQPRLRRGSP